MSRKTELEAEYSTEEPTIGDVDESPSLSCQYVSCGAN